MRSVARHVAGVRSRVAYRGRFETAVHPDDDLLHYALEHAAGARWPAYRAFDAYFNGGRANVEALEEALAGVGPALGAAGSVLEFACGHGRLTRHLVRRLDRARLTVADVDREAVDFVTSTFGVGGFYSATDPAAVVRAERYELILVVSLFSHLPETTWARWMATLLALLEPGGKLVFTSLALRGEAVLPEDREGFAKGFLYKPHNETRGRLHVGDYGTAVQSRDYVLRVLDDVGGELVRQRERAVGVQDAYVVRRRGA